MTSRVFQTYRHRVLRDRIQITEIFPSKMVPRERLHQVRKICTKRNLIVHSQKHDIFKT